MYDDDGRYDWENVVGALKDGKGFAAEGTGGKSFNWTKFGVSQSGQVTTYLA